LDDLERLYQAIADEIGRHLSDGSRGAVGWKGTVFVFGVDETDPTDEAGADVSSAADMQAVVEDALEERTYLVQISVLSRDGRVWLSEVCAEDFVHAQEDGLNPEKMLRFAAGLIDDLAWEHFAEIYGEKYAAQRRLVAAVEINRWLASSHHIARGDAHRWDPDAAFRFGPQRKTGNQQED
jgi:hypothetical protein